MFAKEPEKLLGRDENVQNLDCGCDLKGASSVKTHLIVHFKEIEFVVCKLYLCQVDNKCLLIRKRF